MTRICACGCGRSLEGMRPAARYFGGGCRAKVYRSRKSGMPGRVRSVRPLKSGMVSVIVHVPALWAQEACARQKGDDVRIALP